MPYKRFYGIALLTAVFLSFYPLYAGAVAIWEFTRNGFVDMLSYQKYTIPYAPLCLSWIMVTALHPILRPRRKIKGALFSMLLGALLFLCLEIAFERLIVIDRENPLPLDSWQYGMCVTTPEVLRSIGEPLYAQNNPLYKFHYYLIALVILLTLISVTHNLFLLLCDGAKVPRRPLVLQSIIGSAFICLCVWACLTAFYRRGTINISPVSAALMSAFFIVFGLTAATLVGTRTYGMRRPLSVCLPAVISLLTTGLMYAGELILLDGKLFRFGNGVFFAPIGTIPFAMADILVILLSGILAYGVFVWLNSGDAALQTKPTDESGHIA